MWHLLQLEWLKLRGYKAFRWLIILYIVLLPLLFLVGKSFQGVPEEVGSAQTFYMFPTVFEYLGYAGNWLTFFFLGFAALLMTTQEYTYKTLRQNVIVGLSRGEWYWSKVFTMILISLASALYYGALALLFGATNTDTIYSSMVTVNLDYIPRYFLMCMGYMSFAFLLGVLLRRTGWAILLYISYVMFIEVILRWLLHANILQRLAPTKAVVRTMHFYPMNAIEDLTPLPFWKFANNTMDNPNPDNSSTSIEGYLSLLTPTEATLTTIVYTLIFLGLTWWLLHKRNL